MKPHVTKLDVIVDVIALPVSLGSACVLAALAWLLVDDRTQYGRDVLLSLQGRYGA